MGSNPLEQTILYFRMPNLPHMDVLVLKLINIVIESIFYRVNILWLDGPDCSNASCAPSLLKFLQSLSTSAIELFASATGASAMITIPIGRSTV